MEERKGEKGQIVVSIYDTVRDIPLKEAFFIPRENLQNKKLRVIYWNHCLSVSVSTSYLLNCSTICNKIG